MYPNILFIFAATVSLAHAMEDVPVPIHSSSPGWIEAPSDVSVLIGALVRFNCRTYIFHTETSWIVGGPGGIAHNHPKLSTSSDNVTATFGPIGVEDDGLAIGCEVKSLYGILPSRMGKITVHSKPSYNPKPIQSAYVGKPFEFDFGYTASAPPSLYRWLKNGKDFLGDGGRVTVDYHSICFTNIKHEDAGQYTVEARVKSDVVRATSTLNVLLFKQGDYVQSASSSSPILSEKLAVLVALNSTNFTSSITFHISTDSSSYTSKYAGHVLQLFLKFKKPSSSSRQSGNARVKTERLLLAISQLLGTNASHLTLSDKQLEVISEHAHCVAAKRRPICTLLDLRFRSIDGTCNNFFYPLNGAAETPFARILPALYEDGISDPVGLSQQKAGRPFAPPWPSPRLISFKIIRDLRPTGFGSITHMVMQWGQFLDHDLDIAPVFDEDSCACDITPKCIPIEVKPEDTEFGVGTPNKANCLPFSRSVPACSKPTIPRNQVNDLTSYIDASNVYGSSKEVANSLRLFKGGLLKQGNREKTLKGNLPFQEETSDFGPLPFFFAGDVRVNEQLGLTMMHTIWMREHNRIARLLMRLNPCWNDERIYQETRKIVGAMHQVITFKEFLPILFGSNFRRYVPRYRGYNPFIDATIPASFAGAAYRFGHSLVRKQLDRLDRDYRRLSIGPLPLEQAFFNPIRYFESLGTDPIMRGMTVVKSNPVDEFLNSVLTSQLFVKPGETLGGDLASLNIQRGRDHGLPTYRKWEAFCKRQFPGIRVSFQAPDAQRKLTEIYGVDGYQRGIDLWLGGLAENPLPGGIIGPTFGCILGISFSRVRDGDRFWFQNPYVFTPGQRSTLRQVTLAKVICDNGDDIPTIQRSVFLAGKRRVKCTTVAGLRLNQWWDRRCYNRRRYYF